MEAADIYPSSVHDAVKPPRDLISAEHKSPTLVVALIGPLPMSSVVSDQGVNEPNHLSHQRRIGGIDGARACRQARRPPQPVWRASSPCREYSRKIRCKW